MTGLAPDTIYWFAIRCTDMAGLVGPLSSPFSVKTDPLDTIAPAAVTDLTAPARDTKSNRVTLAWTATGDDGNTGLASGYDLRYSTDPISEANFEAATPVAGLDAPKAPGTLEAATVQGLQPLTTYYFAVKVKDEVPNTSGLSNVLIVETTEQDIWPPETITDLNGQPIPAQHHAPVEGPGGRGGGRSGRL